MTQGQTPAPIKSWSLLKSVADWDRYRDLVSETFSLDVQKVDWGRGPLSFPCLVASYTASDVKVVGCYCYVQDARSLINAEKAIPVAQVAGGAQSSQVPQVLCDLMSSVGQLKDVMARRDLLREDFEKSMIANMLTIVSFLVDTGICKSAQYESRYAANLADVDQVAADDRRRLLSKGNIVDKASDPE